jgi:hypothetical protein
LFSPTCRGLHCNGEAGVVFCHIPTPNILRVYQQDMLRAAAAGTCGWRRTSKPGRHRRRRGSLRTQPQSGFGRMLGYGTVIVRGTGGTFETFDKIAHPTNCGGRSSNKQEASHPRKPCQIARRLKRSPRRGGDPGGAIGGRVSQ